MKIPIVLLFFVFGSCMGSIFSPPYREVSRANIMRHAFYIATDTKKILSILKGFPLYVIFVAKGDPNRRKAKISPDSAYAGLCCGCLFLLIYLKYL